MPRTRRPAETSKLMLIEAAVDIIRAEGYGALTARRLAERVGLKRQIVHYYFGTTEDLLLAVVRHYGEIGLARFAEAARERDPLQVIWSIEADASATSFAFLAMANHHPIIRMELRRYVEKFRKLQVEAVSNYLTQRGVTPTLPPVAITMIAQTVAQALAAEKQLGTSLGHAETKSTIEALLDSFTESGSTTHRDKYTAAKRKRR